jgi:hypothetical protein
VDLPYSKSTKEYGCYVGSTCHTIFKRITEHMKIVDKYTHSELPDVFARSLHYRYICKADVVLNFRALAVFHDTSVSDGYIHLLEAILMMILRSYQQSSDSFNLWNNAESHEIVKTLKMDARIP